MEDYNHVAPVAARFRPADAGRCVTEIAATGCAQPRDGTGCWLDALDDTLLDCVLAELCLWRGGRAPKLTQQPGDAPAWGLRALAASCRRGREVVAACPWVPGLRVALFPHQVAALNRCMSLEARRGQGRVCGGVLCDEAGLGKTITALALIARTRAPLHPRVPKGCRLEPGEVEPGEMDASSVARCVADHVMSCWGRRVVTPLLFAVVQSRTALDDGGHSERWLLRCHFHGDEHIYSALYDFTGRLTPRGTWQWRVMNLIEVEPAEAKAAANAALRAETMAASSARCYRLQPHQLCTSGTPSEERRRILMARDYGSEAGTRRYSKRPRYDTARDPQARPAQALFASRSLRRAL